MRTSAMRWKLRPSGVSSVSACGAGTATATASKTRGAVPASVISSQPRWPMSSSCTPTPDRSSTWRASGRTAALMPGWPTYQSSMGASQQRSSSRMRGFQAVTAPVCVAASTNREEGLAARGEVLRAVVEGEVAVAAGGEPATESACPLEHRHRDVGTRELPGAGETRHARADDRDAYFIHPVTPTPSTRSVPCAARASAASAGIGRRRGSGLGDAVVSRRGP